MPVFLPFLNSPLPMSLVRSVALILQRPLATMQQVDGKERNLKLSMSTVVQDPSGQSSAVNRYDSERQSCSPSQLALSPLAEALNLTACVPSFAVPTTTMLNFPEPVGENAHPKLANGG